MGGTKKQKACNYVRPHAGHVWRDPKSKMDRKYWCNGIGAEATTEARPEHVHIWYQGYMVVEYMGKPIPVSKEEALRRNYAGWQGGCECKCGHSAWLKDGRKVRDLRTTVRFPDEDSYDRLVALHAKLDRGETLTDEDKAELEAIARAIIDVIRPLINSLEKAFIQVGEFIQSFLDQIDPVLMAELVELAKAQGEKPDRVETLSLQTADGRFLENVLVSYDPIGATQHAATEIVEDSIQPSVAPDPTDPVEIAKKAIAEPFKEPFKLDVEGMGGPYAQKLIPTKAVINGVERDMPPIPGMRNRSTN